MLTEKAIAARREYKKKWARNNPDKVKAQQERYWQRIAERLEKENRKKHPGEPGQAGGGTA